jgi:uncharacterized protein YceK
MIHVGLPTVVVFAALAVSSGCMSVIGRHSIDGNDQPHRPYAGTVVDFGLVRESVVDREVRGSSAGAAMFLFGALDAPLSLALDTVLLPSDLVRQLNVDEASASDE